MPISQVQYDIDVSIILVTYNRAHVIARTLDCIVNQTYPHFEVLICDDCSTDGTEQVCCEYVARDKRFTYAKNVRNLKMPGNLNTGLRRARCELVAILHDGDLYAPTTIEKWRAALLKYPTAGFVFNRYRHLNSDGLSGNCTSDFPELMKGPNFLRRCFSDRQLQCPVWGTVMGRKSIYEQMGYFPERYGFFADIDMWFRIAESYDVAYVAEPLIDLPHSNSLPHLFDNKLNLEAHRRIFQIYWNAKRRHYRNRLVTMNVKLGTQITGYAWSLAGRILRKVTRGIGKHLGLYHGGAGQKSAKT